MPTTVDAMMWAPPGVRHAGSPLLPLGAFMLASALLAALLPVNFSILIVVLFAGPHNWFEARFLLSRLPRRLGALRAYFMTGAIGVVVLSGLFVALPWLERMSGPPTWLVESARPALLSAIAVWAGILATMRSRQNPRRDWWWLWPAVLAVAAACWAHPGACLLLMAFAHPLLALVVLDREILAARPGWTRAYRTCMGCIPLCLAGIWWSISRFPPVLEGGLVTFVGGSGRGLELPGFLGLPATTLVATHAFLEMLHYGAWTIAIPLVGMREAPWRLDWVPVARRSGRVRRIVLAGLSLSALLVVALWVCFAVDFEITREIYFTIAIVHVLAEIPFLIRMR